MRASFAQEVVRRTVDDRHHEAGHVVAAGLRSGSADPRDAASWRVRRGCVAVCGDWAAVAPTDRPFVAFAGPWAQARAAWERRAEPGHAGVLEPADPALLEAHLSAAMAHRPADAAAVAAAHVGIAATLHEAGARPEHWGAVARGAQFAWRRELEEAWPAVVVLAHELDRGAEPELDDVRRLIATHRISAG